MYRRVGGDLIHTTPIAVEEDGYATHICSAFNGETVIDVSLASAAKDGVVLTTIVEDYIVEGPHLRDALAIFGARVLDVRSVHAR